MDEFSQYKRVTPGKDEDEFAQYKRAGALSKEEPGWFQPGSKSEAAVRGFSDVATLGFGDEIQAGIRAAGDVVSDPRTKISDWWDKAKQLRNQEDAANKAALEANPKTYLAGGMVGGLPQGIGVARNALLTQGARTGLAGVGSAALGAGTRGAQLGLAQGLGGSNEDRLADTFARTIEGGGLGAVANAVAYPVAAGVGKLLPQGIDKLAAVLKSAPVAETTAPVVAKGLTQQVSLPALGALGNMGYRNVSSDNPINWQEDPYSALGETAIAGAQGAGLGLGAKYGTQVAGQIGGKTAEVGIRAAKAVGNALSQTSRGVDELTTTGSVGPKLFAGRESPFSGLMGRVKTAPYSKPKAPEVDPSTLRKTEMDKTMTTDTGQKSTEPSLSSDSELDDFLGQIRGRGQ